MPAPLELTDISDASIQSTNGGEGRAWQITFYLGATNAGHIFDTENSFSDGAAPASAEELILFIQSIDADIDIPAGYKVDVTSGGETYTITFRTAITGSADHTLYVDLFGDLYTDSGLTTPHSDMVQMFSSGVGATDASSQLSENFSDTINASDRVNDLKDYMTDTVNVSDRVCDTTGYLQDKVTASDELTYHFGDWDEKTYPSADWEEQIRR